MRDHEPGDRTATTVEERIRSEYENWLLPQEDDETEETIDDDEGSARAAQ